MKKGIVLIAGAMLFIACAGPQVQVKKAEPMPVVKKVVTQLPTASPTDTPPKVSGTINLLTALQLALQYNPQLTVFSLEIRAREAAALQASFLPNPEVGVEVENFAGGGPLSGFQATETTTSLGQLIELAGKRRKRTQAANLQTELAGFDFEAKRLEVYAQVVSAFYNVLWIQQQVKLNQEILQLTKEFRDQVAHRVATGRTSPAELSRAEVEVANAQVALDQSLSQLKAARQQLAATWGARQATFDSVAGNFESIMAIPDYDALLAALQNNPDWTRWNTERRFQQAQLSLAKSFRIPDPTVMAGYRRINELDQQAFVAGVSIPLNIFNRNQGNIQQAQVRLKQVAYLESFTKVQLQTQLSTLYQNISGVHQSIVALKDKIIPQAQEAYETIVQGYHLGKFTFLDVLDARRSLFEARQTYLQNLAIFHQLRAEIERLTGKSLEDFE